VRRRALGMPEVFDPQVLKRMSYLIEVSNVVYNGGSVMVLRE